MTKQDQAAELVKSYREFISLLKQPPTPPREE
jgi:hypothetical protein